MISDMKEFNTLIFQKTEDGVGIVTMNRPEQLNATNIEMIEDFDDLFKGLSNDDSIRVLIITGKGRGFSAGADIKDAVTYKDSDAFSNPETFIRAVQERYASLILGLRKIPQPVIAAVNGPAAGGGFCMALASDIRLACPKAYFVASFINIGLSGGELGSSYLLPRLVGLSRTADILYTGRKVWANEAEKIGLVSKIVPEEELIETALSYARMMLAKSTGGLKLTKSVLDQNIDAPSLDAAINLENRNQTIMVFSKEFFNLVGAFAKES